jgi:hypothetical protein
VIAVFTISADASMLWSLMTSCFQDGSARLLVFGCFRHAQNVFDVEVCRLLSIKAVTRLLKTAARYDDGSSVRELSKLLAAAQFDTSMILVLALLQTAVQMLRTKCALDLCKLHNSLAQRHADTVSAVAMWNSCDRQPMLWGVLTHCLQKKLSGCACIC